MLVVQLKLFVHVHILHLQALYQAGEVEGPRKKEGDRTLLQVWRPPITLSIRYTASSSDRLAVLAVDLINSTQYVPG